MSSCATTQQLQLWRNLIFLRNDNRSRQNTRIEYYETNDRNVCICSRTTHHIPHTHTHRQRTLEIFDCCKSIRDYRSVSQSNIMFMISRENCLSVYHPFTRMTKQIDNEIKQQKMSIINFTIFSFSVVSSLSLKPLNHFSYLTNNKWEWNKWEYVRHYVFCHVSTFYRRSLFFVCHTFQSLWTLIDETNMEKQNCTDGTVAV